MVNNVDDKAKYALIYQILDRRTKDTFRQQRANIRRGADPFTEHYAYPYIYPALGPDVRPEVRTTAVRVAALIAEFIDIPQSQETEERKFKSFGTWCSELTVAWARQKKQDQQVSFDPRKPDEIARRLSYIHTQDFEEAFRSIWRLMQMANSLTNPPACDYFSIYRLLTRWGNGVSEESRALRMQILKDYYGSIGQTADTSEN
ncbi:type I-E CRISPR-associated protein Cse2/CasB [Arcanobacterium pinnipediorum]|uniref:Type I-E CRISPR-associated protein Cse2/CasB n=1 Tax=Arcanobacterium pinnipediorum TaxID=1503041 RepID=A0ABY5AGM3_9ACTO|nr:type I-E CRISPR-associated protein Cse2/CasB [Arcanobacterium pinnipediorum]USR79355.1 type I-E CRISPR-associated protein Cse2/CasB [Arcanobacterium pinnipediorum]